MCGIVGIVSRKIFLSGEIIDMLKRLEYRGYDSAGIAMLGSNTYIAKSVGKISELEKKIDKSISGTIGISHTRWATTGAVTENNAHPHTDCKGKVIVVHNGIIENYLELKMELEKNGHRFRSDTDTEIIPHLIEENMNLGWEKSVEKVAEMLEGRNAFIAISTDHEVAVYKNGTPLVIGIDKDRFYIASDALPFLDITKKVIFLDDGDLAFVGNEVKFPDGKEPKVQEIDWNVEKAQKGEYAHFLIKEIMEQPITIENAAAQDDEKIMQIAEMINKSFGSFFVACGTASYAALAASYFFSRISKKHINFSVASEFPLHKHFLTDRSLIIAISQSGETADTLEAVKAAKEMNSKVVSIVNVPGSTLMRQSDYWLLTNAGPEIAVCSTKAFTSQLSVVLLLAYATAGRLEEGKKLLKKAAKEAEKLLTESYLEKIRLLAKSLANKEHIYIIGKGFNYPIALEAALKIKEVSYIHAEGFPSGELKHGVIALIEKGAPCIAIVANDEIKQDVIIGAAEMKLRGGYIIGISPENHEVFDYWIPVPDVGDASPIVNVMPSQLLAYYLALEHGTDPDYLKNLAKSVTVK